MSTTRAPRLLDEVRDLMRVHHYAIRTERAQCDWIRRYVRCHRMASREDLKGGEAKIDAFLTHLAVEGRVAPSTQNQAMNALVLLYKKVLKVFLEGAIGPLLQHHLARVRAIHDGDLARGFGEVYLPHALARKFPSAPKAFIVGVTPTHFTLSSV